MIIDMKKTNENGNNIVEIMEGLKDAIVENRKIVLPIVLVAAILITMGVGIAANRKNEEQEGIQASAPGTTEEPAEEEGLVVPDVPLEENAYPEVNELIMKYFKAMEEDNVDALTEIVSPVTENMVIYFTEWAKHIESCPTVNIYTKPGPRKDSFLAYVVVDMQIPGYEETVPGMITFFVCKNEAGSYYINMESEIDKAEAEYIEAIDMQEDVADLSNRVNVEYKQLVSPGSDAAKAFRNVDESITKGVQEGLIAKQEAEAAAAATEETAEQEQPETEAPATVATEAKAVEVVNMRSSDSEKADKLGKAQIGDTFQVLEQRANGWTKLTDGTQEFFIKSEFLEITAEAPANADAAPAQEQPQEQPAEEETAQETETPASNRLPGSNGYVTATTTVNVRKSASETGERLGTIYMGERLELVMNQADGWTKVKYQGQTAYVKTEFLE